MKDTIHPKYQKVLFVDSSTGTKRLIGTTLQPKEKEMFDGKEYPVCHVSISSSSHPFFVGGKSYVDTEGRVDKFNKRYQMKQKPVDLDTQQDQAQQDQKQQAKEEQAAAQPEKKKKK